MTDRLRQAAGRGHHPGRSDASRRHRARCGATPPPASWRTTMQWTTPTATDLRFGFEITMYVAAR